MRLKPDVANAAHRVFDQRHERRDADVHQAGESDVRVRQRVIDWRRDHGADRRRDAPRDLVGNQHVGEQRGVRPVLFGRARGNDDGVMRFEERLDFGVGHLAEEDGWRFHGGNTARSQELPSTGTGGNAAVSAARCEIPRRGEW